MNKTKKILVGALACACVFSASMGFVACKEAAKKEQATLTVLTSSITYRVGDNLDLFDIFEYKEGQTYTFALSIDGAEAEEIEGETVYLDVAGVYELTATAMKGASVLTKKATVNVYDKAPHIVLQSSEVTVELYDKKLPVALINLASPIILSEGEHWEYVSEVEIYQDEENPTVVEIEDGVATSDGFFDGRRFTFLYECDYLFTIISETSGGQMATQLKITALEDFSRLETLDSVLTFDEEQGEASWETVAGAASYRVKIGKDAVETEETSVNISEYLTDEFKFFDLVVVPKDEAGEKMGKMMIEDIIIAPEGSENLVLGRGVKSIDSATRTVTLKGEESPGPGWKSEISKFQNSHVAFYGDYGVGYAIDVEFTGNNLPQICFFANGTEEGDHGINGTMTSYGGTGWMLMNGLYAKTKDASTSTTNVIGENVLLAWGPNRMSPDEPNHALGNYITISEHTSSYHISKNTLLSQKALREDDSGRTYVYTARTCNMNGYLGFICYLKDKATGEYVVTPQRWVSGKYKAEEVKPGNIILYACVKGEGEDTTFTYSQPYFFEGEDEPYNDYVANGNYFASKNATISSDGTITLPSKETGGTTTVSGLSGINTEFVSTTEKYGLGTYVDFYFTGNNMPQVMFFADYVNGNITEHGGKGVLLMNGLVKTSQYSTRMDEMLAFGPKRIRLGSAPNYSDSGYELGVYLTKLQSTGNANYPGDYPLLSQQGLSGTPNANYKYTVGMYEGDDEYLHIDIYLYNADDDTEIYHVDRKTTLLVADMPVTEGYIVAYAGYKGANTTTTFKCSEPYEKQAEEILQSGATVNADGSITLDGNQAPGGVRVEDLTNIVTSYYAIKGDYGLGTYIDLYFTGNNLPQVMFFADKINGNITLDGGTGVLLMNGMAKANASTLRPDEMLAFGPNRISSVNAGYDSGVYLTKFQSTGNDNYPGNYPLLSQTGLSGTPNANYKYTVGMYGGTDGYLYIDIYLYNADDNSEIYHVDRKTKLLVADMSVTSGNIILYGGYKGSAQTTTFKYTAPYTKQ